MELPAVSVQSVRELVFFTFDFACTDCGRCSTDVSATTSSTVLGYLPCAVRRYQLGAIQAVRYCASGYTPCAERRYELGAIRTWRSSHVRAVITCLSSAESKSEITADCPIR
eukprot:124153-Rhodomonas_salina.1